MKTKITQQKITIDANGRSLGRVATEASVALRGKHLPAFERHIEPPITVEIVNAKALKITPLKMQTKIYKRYSGYPGGLKERNLEQLVEKKGYDAPLRHAIRGMLPANRMRAKLLKKLIIVE